MSSTLKFGLLGGILLAVTVPFYSYGISNAVFTIFQVIVMAFSIYFGVKEEKKVKHNNTISYRDAIFTGLKINFMIAVIHSLTIFFYYNSNPEAIEQLKKTYIEKAVSDLKKFESKDSEIKDHVAFIKKEITPFNQAKYNFMIILVLGLLFCLIITAILRTKTPEELAEKKS